MIQFKTVESGDDVKICRDCKWFFYAEYAGCVCKRPKEEIVDLVNGYKYSPNYDCFDERGDKGLCGKEAKFWEAK